MPTFDFTTLLHPDGWLAAPTWLVAQATESAGFDLWGTFQRAELAGKIIVILLLIFSLLAWTVMIGKYLDLSRWRQMNLSFQARLREKQTLLGQTLASNLRHGGPYARLFHDAVESSRQHRGDGNSQIRLSLIENALQRGVAAECVRYETKMVLLGSLVTGAPFIGLLGTVWGVMVAFSGMSQGSASITNIAPGVASALLATVCGLLVAIPSVFGYNFLLTQVKVMITELENFASWLADRLEIEMEEEKPTAAPSAITQPARAIPPEPTSVDPGVKAAEKYLKLDVSEDDPPI